ncbi:MAG: heme biosynthesis protein HemY, partial [Hyphomicrobiales bacterium]
MIIRIALIALAAWGVVWLADRPGTVTIDWLGKEITLPILATLLAMVLAFVVLMMVWGLVRRVIKSPGALSGFFGRRREKKAYDALTKGIVAVGAGDAGQATKFANKASKLTGNDSLAKLLTAQAAQLRGDTPTVRRVFEDMTTSPDTEVLGLRGLFTQARQDGDMEAARGLAERAFAKNPDLPWASRAMLAIQSAEQDWSAAARTLENQRRAGTITKVEEDRRRAVVLTAQALDMEQENPDEAQVLAERAHKLAPELVPAVVVAGRLLVRKANTRKAARILEKTWKLSPHPDVADVYAYLRSGDSPQDRQRRITQLIGMSSGELEGALALARTCIDAQDWKDARKALTMYVDDRPPVRVCEMMAEIEQGEHGDKGLAREWLGRAVHAPRDPVWVADGYASRTWLPVSPVTGELDAFAWKVPVEGLAAPVAEAEEEDIVAADITDMVSEEVSDAQVEEIKEDVKEAAHDVEVIEPSTADTVTDPAKEAEPVEAVEIVEEQKTTETSSDEAIEEAQKPDADPEEAEPVEAVEETAEETDEAPAETKAEDDSKEASNTAEESAESSTQSLEDLLKDDKPDDAPAEERPEATTEKQKPAKAKANAKAKKTKTTKTAKKERRKRDDAPVPPLRQP